MTIGYPMPVSRRSSPSVLSVIPAHSGEEAIETANGTIDGLRFALDPAEASSVSLQSARNKHR
jgi:hypothetical protein